MLNRQDLNKRNHVITVSREENKNAVKDIEESNILFCICTLVPIVFPT
jgi:hypothetical protein